MNENNTTKTETTTLIDKIKSDVKQNTRHWMAVAALAFVTSNFATYLGTKWYEYNEKENLKKQYHNEHYLDGVSIFITNDNGKKSYDISARFGREHISLQKIEELNPAENYIDTLAKNNKLGKYIEVYHLEQDTKMNIGATANDCYLGVGVSRMIVTARPTNSKPVPTESKYY